MLRSLAFKTGHGWQRYGLDVRKSLARTAKSAAGKGPRSGDAASVDSLLEPPARIDRIMSPEQQRELTEWTNTYSKAMFRIKRREQRSRHKLIRSRLLAYYELPEHRRKEADKLDLTINPLSLFQIMDSQPIEGYTHATRRRFANIGNESGRDQDQVRQKKDDNESEAHSKKRSAASESKKVGAESTKVDNREDAKKHADAKKHGDGGKHSSRNT
mmetsp:Transcript_11118/g.34084  ORF Transcript_11118/g.34084 Transcript_11118/m.34084 type:complete len:215 (+) Transcript_11118:84-728(+)